MSSNQPSSRRESPRPLGETVEGRQVPAEEQNAEPVHRTAEDPPPPPDGRHEPGDDQREDDPAPEVEQPTGPLLPNSLSPRFLPIMPEA